MLNSVDAIKQQNIFRVQPVKWNEPNKQEKQAGTVSNFITGSGQYSPNHPNMQSPERANFLDLLA